MTTLACALPNAGWPCRGMSLFGRRSASAETASEITSPRGQRAGISFTSPREKAAPIPYKADDVKELMKSTYFDEKDIKTLGEIYRKHTTSRQKTIPVEQMRNIPETAAYPLFQRIVQMYNIDKNGDIDFKEFVHAMSALSPRAVRSHRATCGPTLAAHALILPLECSRNEQTLDEKLRTTFKLFDMTGDGSIEEPEVFQLLRMTMGMSISDENLRELTRKFLERFPNGMDYEAFCQFISVSDLEKLTLALMDSSKA